MTKQELRKIYLEKRKNISHKDKLKLDDLMLIEFQRLPLYDEQILMTYFPMPENNEPDTFLISNYLRHAVPDLKTCYPKTDFKTREMDAVLITEETVYKKNNQHITEPSEGEIIRPEAIDIMLVPLVICDSKGFRVGYGKGFYDKYLASCRENILKIGLSYFPPVPEITGVEDFDIPLNYCITPDTIYEF